MRYFIDVWFKPWIELSSVDRFVMSMEAAVLLILIAVVKVYVIDSMRGKGYVKR